MRITAFEVGPGKASVKKNTLKVVCTDGNFSYEKELGMNADIKHIVSKSENVWFCTTILLDYIAKLSATSNLYKCYSSQLPCVCIAECFFVNILANPKLYKLLTQCYKL